MNDGEMTLLLGTRLQDRDREEWVGGVGGPGFLD